MSTKRYLTITALTRYIKKKFDVDSNLQEVWLKGEISNFKQHSRGHMYLTLKDENARIQAAMFQANNRHLKFSPEDGMKVIVRGEVSVYEPYGQYQLYIHEMQPDGIGNLYLAFEELKKRLELEGLFAQDIKKPLPRFPETIGIVTSPTGAAVRDIFTTIKRRYPSAKIILIPALVQGENAAASIKNAIEKANDVNGINVLIIGRGGGSIEDLWPFNEEVVARAIYKSTVPTIAAVGHETDFTIADFVADMRAPTPTGAAELAVPHMNELKERIIQRQTRLYRAIKDNLSANKLLLKKLKQSYAFRFPQKLYQQKEQELDKNLERLEKKGQQYVQMKKDKWEQLNKRLIQQHPTDKIIRSHDRMNTSFRRMDRAVRSIVKEKELTLGQAVSKLNALNPLQVMERGYGLVYQEKDHLVKSITQVEEGDNVSVRLRDGMMDCHVLGKEESDQDE